MRPISFANLHSAQRITSIGLLIISSIAIPLRLWVKTKILRTVNAADYAIIIAYLLFAAMVIANLEILHLANNPTSTGLGDVVASILAYNTLYTACSIASKLSVSLFINHILGIHRPAMRAIATTVWVISSVLGLLNTALVLDCGAQALLRMKFAQICASRTALIRMTITWTGSNILADSTFALLCFGVLWSANMTTRSKLSAGSLLCFGSLGAFFSVLRLMASAGWGSNGFAGGAQLVNVFSNLEVGITIIAVCLATTKPLITRLVSKFRPPKPSMGLQHLDPAEFSNDPHSDNTCLWSFPGVIAFSYPLDGGVATCVSAEG